MKPATSRRGGFARRYWPFVPKSAEEASQGEKGGHMQWVLGLSVAFIVAAFAAVYIYTSIFAAHQ